MTRIRKETWNPKIELRPLSIWKALCWHIRFKKNHALANSSLFLPTKLVYCVDFRFGVVSGVVLCNSSEITWPRFSCFKARCRIFLAVEFQQMMDISADWSDFLTCWDLRSCSKNKLVWITLDDLCPRASAFIRSRPSRSKVEVRGGRQIILVYFTVIFEFRLFCEFSDCGQEYFAVLSHWRNFSAAKVLSEAGFWIRYDVFLEPRT